MEIIETESGLEIQHKRGNTGSLTISFDLDGVNTPFVDGDKVTFTVRQSLEGTVVFQHVITTFVSGEAEINVAAIDTKTIVVPENTWFNEYVFDTKIELASGDVSTLGPGLFKLIGVATHE